MDYMYIFIVNWFRISFIGEPINVYYYYCYYYYYYYYYYYNLKLCVLPLTKQLLSYFYFELKTTTIYYVYSTSSGMGCLSAPGRI